MSIRGLTDRGGALPRIGELRKGAAKGNGNAPGKDLDYFRFTTQDREVAELFRERIGTEPREITVTLAYERTDQNFEAWREHWVAGGLMHRCDGVDCVVSRDEKGNYSREPKPCPGGCKSVGRLHVLIPKLERLAIVTLLTTSEHDIINIQGCLQAIETLNGTLRGVPFLLSRRPREISVPRDGRRVRATKNLIHIELAQHFVTNQLVSMERKALLPVVVDGEDIDHNGVDEIGVIDITKDGDVIALPPTMSSESEEPNSIKQEQFTRIGEMTEALIKADVWTSTADGQVFLKQFAGVKSRHGLSEAKASMVIEELKRRWASVFEAEARAEITAEDVPF